MRITIIGLGQMGSSLGLGFKGIEAGFEIIGHDKDNEAAKRAHKRGCVDRTDWNLISACDGTDLVVLSIPLAGIKDTLAAIAHDLKPGCVVTDTANLKVPVLNWARESLPSTVHFVGGHPITKAVAEPVEPTADFLAGATYCLIPGTSTPPEALQTVSDLVEAMGAIPYYLDAAEHDGLIAAVEQLPLLAALVLQLLTGSSPSRREMIHLTGPNLSRVMQLLAGDAQSLTDACIQNEANITRWLDVLESGLSSLRDLVASQDGESLQESFAAALAMRERWMKGDSEGQARDYSDFGMARMFTGDMFKPRQPKGE